MLKRLLQSELLNQLAMMLLDGRIREGEVVKVTASDEKGLVVAANHDAVRTADPNEVAMLTGGVVV